MVLRPGFRDYVESRLPREDDKKLFRDLLEAYIRGGSEEVKASVKAIISDLSGV